MAPSSSQRRRIRGTSALAAATAAAFLLAGCAAGSPGGDPGDGEAASYGEISVQYSWIKNEEFAGEFYADKKGYYTDAGFDSVIGVSGPETPTTESKPPSA